MARNQVLQFSCSDKLKKDIESIFKRKTATSFAKIAKELNAGHDDVIVSCQELDKEGKISLLFSSKPRKGK